MRVLAFLVAVTFFGCSAKQPSNSTELTEKPVLDRTDDSDESEEVEDDEETVATPVKEPLGMPRLDDFDVLSETSVKTDLDHDKAYETLIRGELGFDDRVVPFCRLDVGRESWLMVSATQFQGGPNYDKTKPFVLEPAGLPKFYREPLAECLGIGSPSTPTSALHWMIAASVEVQTKPKTGDVLRWSIPWMWDDGKNLESSVRIPMDNPPAWASSYVSNYRPDEVGALWAFYSPWSGKREEVARAKASKLHATLTELTLEKDGKFAIVFITRPRFGGPEKLRFGVSQAVGLVDDETVWLLQPGSDQGQMFWILRDGEQLGLEVGQIPWLKPNGDSVSWDRYEEVKNVTVTGANGQYEIVVEWPKSKISADIRIQ